MANSLVDWMRMSGVHGIKKPQAVLGVKADGLVGPNTINALNSYPSQRELFDLIKKARYAFIDDICKSRPANEKFRKGWCNRLESLTFQEG